ncbi:MAG: FimB/Mfa2 family fimbrial subunit [Odoribacteraceae bacterium]|nr:FimB/Mfa2 family fimbrial subunit [Odoribacteraceae bacterium]
MKKPHYHQQRARAAVAILLLWSIVVTCGRDKNIEDENLSYNLVLRATLNEVIPDIRLFAFHKQANVNRFGEEILNLHRSSDKISARVKEGNWDIAMISATSSTPILLPPGGKSMEETPLYRYTPVVDPATGKSSDADEIFITREPVVISPSKESTLSARLDRNVAMVEVIIEHATANFNKAATDHRVELHRVPSTISYTGALLPNKNTPDTLTAEQFLRAPIKLQDHPTESGHLQSNVVRFLVPAHRGTDFSAANPVDTTTLKMLLTVNLQRTAGTRFIKSREIPVVARCNHVMRVRVNVNDGVSFTVELLPWSGYDIPVTVGSEYSNWLYVKRGGSGNGLSWSDPLPDVSTAISMAASLKAQSLRVNGILVAGGTATGGTATGGTATGAYEESFSVPAGIKIFGGWTGTPGEELPANNPLAPYTSSRRDLANRKAIISPRASGIVLDADSTLLDGVIIKEVSGSVIPLLVDNVSARVNAVEVRDNNTSGNAIIFLSGTGTNVLVANNANNVYLDNSATLVNATIVNNTAAAIFYGKLQNSVYWGNGGTPVMNGTIQNSAFSGAKPPAGTRNIAINAGNTVWFSSTDTVPGPHFDLSPAAGYATSSTNPNRSPLLGRGDSLLFNAAVATAALRTDINGRPRHNADTDIGCHEGVGSVRGFNLRWNMTSIYISTKENRESEHPAILFDNAEGAFVKWHVTVKSVTSTSFSVVQGRESGGGNAVHLGVFKLKSGKENTGNSPIVCGKIALGSNLGNYLPSTELDVYQTPGKSAPWTNGYAGSFHRNNEVEERLVFGSNTGNWIVRIVSGLDWIKIDRHPRGYNSGIVEETFGGILSGSGNIEFRVGMKSALPSNASPRYGLIAIDRAGGVALFFVRQGEAADYIYGPSDPGRTKAPAGRPDAAKFSPYNLTDPKGSFDKNGVLLGKRGGGFVDYPSKTGYFFKYNNTRAFYPDNTIPGTAITTAFSSIWSAENDPCPSGYHLPSNPEFVEGYFVNEEINTEFSGGVKTTFVWGRLADGYFDRIATPDVRECGSGPNRATEGLIIYNDYNNASVFFPMAGKRIAAEPPGTSDFHAKEGDGGGHYVQWTMTRTPQDAVKVFTTHSYGVGNTGHIGMSCSWNDTYKYEATSIRCVKD